MLSDMIPATDKPASVRKTYRPHYEDMAALLADACAPANETWKGRKLSSRKFEENFNMCKNFEECVTFARDGWAIGSERMHMAVQVAANSTAFDTAPAFMYDVAGGFPNPALAAAGAMDCMVSPVPVESRARPVLRLTADLRVPGMMHHKCLFAYGAALACVIDALETNGVRVEFSTLVNMTHGAERLVAQTMIKQAHDALDLDRLAFAIANGDFFRRLHFALIERHFNAGLWGVTYGYGDDKLEPGKDYEDDVCRLPGPGTFKASQLSDPETALASVLPIFGDVLADRYTSLPPHLYLEPATLAA